MARDGESAGTSHIGWFGVGFVGTILILFFAFATYALVAIWPKEVPSARATRTDTTDTTKTAGTDTAKSEAKKTDSGDTKKTNAGDVSKTDTTDTKTDTTKTDTTRTDTTKTDTTAGPCADDADCQVCEKELDVVRPIDKKTPRDLGADCVKAFGRWWLLWPERRLLLLVLLAGMLGSLLHALRSWTWYAGQRELRWSWIPYYLGLPFIGPAIAFVLYIVIRGGFFGSGSNVSDTNTLAFVALAALAGLFSEEAIRKLKKIAGSIFEAAEKGKDATTVVPSPSISGIDPSPLPTGTATQKITVTGSNFDVGSSVFAGTSKLDTTFKSATMLEAKVPTDLQKPSTTLDIKVVSGSGAASPITKLPIT